LCFSHDKPPVVSQFDCDYSVAFEALPVIGRKFIFRFILGLWVWSYTIE